MRLARFLAASIALGALSLPVAAQAPLANVSAIEGVTIAGERVVPSRFDGDVRTLSQAAPSSTARERWDRRILPGPPNRKTVPGVPPAAGPRAPLGPSAPMPATDHNFPGMSFSDACTGGQCGAGWPPDTNGDVGPNHYIQAVNEGYAIYSKTGTKLASFTENQLWSAAGASTCNGNSQGDPIVVYDGMADRWILTHFAFRVLNGVPIAPFYQCIAVSKTADPVAGGWYFYALRMDPGTTGTPPSGALNDYGKFGIWNDCLYMSANEFKFPAGSFVGTLYASFSRADLYAGTPLTWSLGFIDDNTGPFTMIPSNASGKSGSSIAPGTPNYFVSESTYDYNFEVRKFTPGTNCGAGGTLGAPVLVSQASYEFNLPGVEQPNTGNKLDAIDDRLMQKVQYRKVGSKESLWVTHNVLGPTLYLGMQWAQIDVTGGVVATTPVQQGIHAPDSSVNRWMGSLAVDGAGNMALGYSTSGDTAPKFPSIAYAGRLATDPLNTLPQTERVMIAGAGSQVNNCGGAPCERWGDYSAMSVDPVDDCTFWYTNEYYSSQANGNVGNWQTRIGSFKFPSCSVAPPSTTLLTSSANPAFAGVAVTFTAAVSGVSPSGTVQFTDNAVAIAGCGAVALAGSGNTRTAACTTSSLSIGTRAIAANYSGDSGNGASSGSLTQTIALAVPGSATVVANPYGAVTVTGATINGNTIFNFSAAATIQLGNVAGAPGSFAEIDFLSLNVGTGNSLTIRSGAPGQAVVIVNTGPTASAIAGTFSAQGGNGAPPPVLYFKNANGISVQSGGGIAAQSGLGLDALGATWTTGSPLVNAGTIDGGANLDLFAGRINGGGSFKGNAITFRTFGLANNPVNGAYFLQNGLQLYPGSGNEIFVTLNGYGSTPQVFNLFMNGNATVWMPSAWPAGSTVPQNNAVVPPSGSRPAGTPQPAYGGGSMILQATGSMTLHNGGTNDFVFPGAIVLKAANFLNVNGVTVDQGWTTSGQAFQGIFFESPNIVSPNGLIMVYGNDLNWMNFSTFPQQYVRAFSLKANPDTSASFVPTDSTTPHINTYSVIQNTAASGGCWTCIINTQPVNMYGP
jgi:hypothetical protein